MTATHCRRLAYRARGRLATAVLAGLAGGLCLTDAVSAKGGRDVKREEFVQSRPAGSPVMAVVSLGRQRVTLYDADGWIMRAPVSSGQTGYETPAGIYSILGEAAGIAGMGLVTMMAITCADVVLRKLGHPLPGAYELVKVAAAVTML